MEKELVELYEVVRKAAEAASVEGDDAEEARCLDAMKQLKKFPINYNVLVSSQVGKSLRKLTKHPREKIKALASDIVEIWKQIIVRETMKNKNSENPANQKPEKPETMKNKNSEKPANQKPEKPPITAKPENVKNKNPENLEDPDKRSHKVPKPLPSVKPERSNPSFSKKPENPAPPKLSSLIYTKDADRDQLREAIANALSKVSDESEGNDDIIAKVNACDPYRVAVQVETALFEKWGSAKGSNKMRYRSVKFNLTDSKNPDFRRRVLLGEFPPHSIPELTPEDMASNERKMQNEKIKEKALFNSQRGGPSVASTNAFKCGKCGKRECTYFQLQTRSADEPMTTFVTCANCDNRWKF
ncbi:hypothetical protein DM860_013641 [Cuscuta australis]|uniref:Transcription elongation factor n=1 Tax=Cuscuta australis TaxID=267555 RepID=A0A328EA46_9ASTE|nr:hypothetical protein DM860_013641 [Cuscuta australis]